MVQPQRWLRPRFFGCGSLWRCALHWTRHPANSQLGASLRSRGLEALEARAMLAAIPGPPAPTPIGLQGENCAASFLAPQEFDSPPAPYAAPAPQPAGGPPLSLFVTVTADEDDGNTTEGDLSLREAIKLANAAESDVTIHVPAGEFTLLISGGGENGNGQGDLDLGDTNFTTRIIGDARGTTIIRSAVDDRIFHVLPGSIVEISHLTVQNGIADVGGGILNQGMLTLTDVLVQFNLAGDKGGGVGNGAGATLHVIDSSIDDNQADLGGGIFNDRNAALTLDDSNVTSNTANSGGGVFNHGGAVNAIGSHITQNNADESGGGVSNLSTTTAATFTLDHATVNLNSIVTQPFQPGLAQGGGICNAAQGSGASAVVTVIGGEVSGNRAQSGDSLFTMQASAQGGGIFSRATNGTASTIVTIEDAMVNGNLASAIGSSEIIAQGGAIYNRAENASTTAQVNISSSDVSSNAVSSLALSQQTVGGLATSQGGAIYNRANLQSATASIGVYSSTTSSNAAISNSDGSSQTVSEGGGVFNVAGTMSSATSETIASITVQGGEVRSNTSSSLNGSTGRGSGGGLANVADFGKTLITITDATVGGNRASVDSLASPVASGGGIYNRVASTSGNSKVTITRTTVRDNLLSIDGGANPAAMGGGVYSQGVGVLLRDSTVSSNQAGASGKGGGLFTRQAATLVNSTVSSNESNVGAGIVVDNGAVSLMNSSIVSNTAENANGGVLIVGGASVTAKNTLIAKNFGFSADQLLPSDASGVLNATSTFNWIGAGDGLAGISNGAGGNRVGTVAAPLDPMIGDLANNGGPTKTHLILFGSPLIDQGESGFNPADFDPALLQDQRTKSRVLDGNGDAIPRIDIGAVEYSPAIFADLNGDGRVNLIDLMTLQRNLGGSSKSYLDGDLNGDALVNRADLALLLTNYGKTGPAPSPPASPATGASPGAAAGIVQRVRKVAAIDHALAEDLSHGADLPDGTAKFALSARRSRKSASYTSAPPASLPSAGEAMIIASQAGAPRKRRS